MSQWGLYSENILHGGEGFQESFDFDYSSTMPEKGIDKTLESVLPTQGWPEVELSEINCLSAESVLQLLLPTLAKLNAQNRWISLISPPGDINAKLFSHYGIDPSRVLLIHPKNDVDDKVTMNKALKNGTSGIVILWASQIHHRYLAQWRKSVKQGNSSGIIVNTGCASSDTSSIALSFNVETTEKSMSVSGVKIFGIQQAQKNKILFSKNDFSAKQSALHKHKDVILN